MKKSKSNGIIEEMFESPGISFKEHLRINDNNRIIFSGKFGMGKSTFLNHFFKENKQFNAIHLYPICYSVSSNEDIFKYLKYDIIYEMMRNKYDIEFGEDFDISWVLKSVISQNIQQLASSYAGALPAIGKDISTVSTMITFWESISKSLSLIKKAKEKVDKINDEAFEMNVMQKYLQTFISQDGGLKEFGIETQLIKTILERQKDNSKKENILIIDDLDRIDPEHIFRILNIFAAHYDHNDNNKNKFGFDKIILVCDIQNIKSVFHYKYGIGVDFNGYIDKFYSYEIFKFWNKSDLIDFIEDFIKIDKWKVSVGNEGALELILGNKFLSFMLFELAKQDILNLRNLLKIRDFRLEYSDTCFYKNDYINSVINSLIFQLCILGKISGSKIVLLDWIDKLSEQEIVIDEELMIRYMSDLFLAYCSKENIVYFDGKRYHLIFKHSQDSQKKIIDKVDLLNSQSRDPISIDKKLFKLAIKMAATYID